MSNVGTPLNVVGNSPGRITDRGAEMEFVGTLTPDTLLFANYSVARALQYAAPGAPATELADVPIHKVNAGASYRMRAPLDLTGTLLEKWVSGYRAGTNTDPNTRARLANPDGNFVLDANVIYRATSHASVELMVRNILDAQYMLPAGGLPN